MSKIVYQDKSAQYYTEVYPEDTIENGDLLIFRRRATEYHLYWKSEGVLRYGFQMPSYAGSAGPAGTPGQDGPIREVSEITIVPAIHIGDTTPDTLSTYWLKSDGMYEKKYTAYNVFTWEKI